MAFFFFFLSNNKENFLKTATNGVGADEHENNHHTQQPRDQ